MQLEGFHHVTAITADARANHAFYTQVMGLRLVKKTVNQDDTSVYHLFFADGVGAPGTDMTFFEFRVPPERRGGRSITRTGFRVAGRGSLDWWGEWLSHHGLSPAPVATINGRATLDFEDPEGQRLALTHDEEAGAGHPWSRSPVPAEHQIRGLGPVEMTVPESEPTEAVLTDLMKMRRSASGEDAGGRMVHIYESGSGGAAELRVIADPDAPPARQGAGGVHHVAFRIPESADYEAWADHLRGFRVPSSGPVDRFYFRSLYFREPGGVLFELATDEPGFDVDEPSETMGEKLALPPFLEDRRQEIEARLNPL